MNTDPDRAAEQLLTEAAELGRAARALNRAAGAAPAIAADGSGQIEVRVASDGSPDQILVRAGWQRNLHPSRLGAAVMEAAQDAARTAARQRSTNLAGSGWRDQVADLGAGRLDVAGGVADFGRLDGSALGELPDNGQVRDVNELADVVIKALANAALFSERVVAQLDHPAGGEGVDDSGQVQVTIAGGQVSGCQIAEGWAAGRDGHTVAAALTQAARRAAAAVPALPAVPRGPADTLVADVLATLRYDTDQQTAPGTAGLQGQEQHR